MMLHFSNVFFRLRVIVSIAKDFNFVNILYSELGTKYFFCI